MHGHWHCIFKEVRNFPLSQFLLKTQKLRKLALFPASGKCMKRSVASVRSNLLAIPGLVSRKYKLCPSFQKLTWTRTTGLCATTHSNRGLLIDESKKLNPGEVTLRWKKDVLCLHLPTKSTGNKISDATSKGADQLKVKWQCVDGFRNYTHGVDSVLVPHNKKENQLMEDSVLLPSAVFSQIDVQRKYFSDYRIRGKEERTDSSSRSWRILDEQSLHTLPP